MPESDRKKPQMESLDDAVKLLGVSKRAINEVVRLSQEKAEILDGARVGSDLLHALTRRIKSEEGQPAAEQVKEQCLYAMHECLMQVDGIGKSSTKLCSQIETLAEKCTEHVPRTLIKARGSRAPIAEHLVKTAENNLKILQAWRRKFACFKKSDRLKATGRALQTLIKPRDQEPLLDGPPKKAERPAKRMKLAEPAPPVIALPADLAGYASSSAALLLPVPPSQDAGWGRGLGAQSPPRAVSDPVSSSAVPIGRARLFDACRLIRDVCSSLQWPTTSQGAALFLLHHLLQHASMEPAFSKPPAWKKHVNRPGMVAEHVAQALPSDELAALALACVHLGGKACDTPARLTHVLEFARSRPQNSMALRHWPRASPFRDAVLVAEQRLLRLVAYDVRLENANDVLKTCFSKVLPDEQFRSFAGHGNAAAPPRLGDERLTMSHALRERTRLFMECAHSFLFSGVSASQDPRALCVATALIVNRMLKDPGLKLIEGFLDAAAEFVGKHLKEDTKAAKARILGCKAEIEKTDREFLAHFSEAETKKREKADTVGWDKREAACGAARRSAEATRHRLGALDLKRYVKRCLDQAGRIEDDRAKVAAARARQAPEAEIATLEGRLKQQKDHALDDCVCHVFVSDDAELYRACPDDHRTPVADLRLAFPFGPAHYGTKADRLDDAHDRPPPFRLGACLVHCCAEPDADAKTFRPALYCAWPRAIVDALKLGTRARSDVHKATARLAKALRDAHKRNAPYDVYTHAPAPAPRDPGPAPAEKPPAWGPPRGDAALLAKPPLRRPPGPRPADPPKPLLERIASDAGRMQRLPDEHRRASDNGPPRDHGPPRGGGPPRDHPPHRDRGPPRDGAPPRVAGVIRNLERREQNERTSDGSMAYGEKKYVRGYIGPDDGSPDIYYMTRGAPGDDLRVGQRVTYERAMNQKGPIAHYVEPERGGGPPRRGPAPPRGDDSFANQYAALSAPPPYPGEGYGGGPPRGYGAPCPPRGYGNEGPRGAHPGRGPPPGKGWHGPRGDGPRGGYPERGPPPGKGWPCGGGPRGPPPPRGYVPQIGGGGFAGQCYNCGEGHHVRDCRSGRRPGYHPSIPPDHRTNERRNQEEKEKANGGPGPGSGGNGHRGPRAPQRASDNHYPNNVSDQRGRRDRKRSRSRSRERSRRDSSRRRG